MKNDRPKKESMLRKTSGMLAIMPFLIANPLMGNMAQVSNAAGLGSSITTQQGGAVSRRRGKAVSGYAIDGPGNNTKGKRPDRPRWLRRILELDNVKHKLKSKRAMARRLKYI